MKILLALDPASSPQHGKGFYAPDQGHRSGRALLRSRGDLPPWSHAWVTEQRSIDGKIVEVKVLPRTPHLTLHPPRGNWRDQFRRGHRTFAAKKSLIIEVRRAFRIMLENGAVWPGARRAVPNRLKAVGLRVFVSRYAARADLIVRRRQFLARVRRQKESMRTV